MKTIWFGLLLILLDFNLDSGTVRIGLLPDFAGYILLCRGFRTLCGESERFVRLIPFSAGMALFTGVLYAFDLFGLSFSVPALTFWLGIAALFLAMCMSYWIVLGIRELEQRRQFDLGGDGLMRYWSVMFSVMAVSLLLQVLDLLAALAVLASFISVICFLAAFYQMEKRYAAIE